MKNANFKNLEFISPKYERDNINLDLSKIVKVLKKLENPCGNIPAIQIVGTNGKGSICAFKKPDVTTLSFASDAV